jgi:hypothetical protein
MAIRLKKCEVTFNEGPHTYELNGKFLKGVTQVLHEQPMFADMYSTEAYYKLKENKAWQESGYTEKDLYRKNEQGVFYPTNLDELVFFNTDEEKYELMPLIYDAQAEQVRIERNKQNAAIRGKEVHDACEALDMGKSAEKLSENAQKHASIYVKLRRSLGMTPVACEYLVSDLETIASQIDLVWQNSDGDICLADIKCVSKMDDTYILYLRWQLSIYKYLFELQNKSKKVKGLYGVWLPQKEVYGKANIFELTPIPEEEVKALLECVKQGIKYQPVESFSLPATITSSLEEYLARKARIKEDTEFVKKFETELLSLFDANDIKKWEFKDKAMFTRTLPGTKQSFDSKRFQEEQPELYAEYQKTTTTNSSLRITLK